MFNKTKKQARKERVRAKIFGTEKRPRLSVFRSNKYIYAQIINDEKSETLSSVYEKELGKLNGNKTERAKQLGLLLAKKSIEKKIKNVIFDRGSYKYHGRVKAFAEGAREGGLAF